MAQAAREGAMPPQNDSNFARGVQQPCEINFNMLCDYRGTLQCDRQQDITASSGAATVALVDCNFVTARCEHFLMLFPSNGKLQVQAG